MDSLVNFLSGFIMTIIGGEGSAKVQANLLTKTCQSVDLQNSCKEADEDGICTKMTEGQTPYKLPLNPELTVFYEKPDESVNSAVGYQHSFEDNR